MQTRDEAVKIKDLITAKLSRIMSHTVDGPTIRTIKSLIRLTQREFNATYGSDAEQYEAEYELAINKDNGSQVRLSNMNHTVGIFGCLACTTNDALKPMSRRCQHCWKGIQHAHMLVSMSDGSTIDPNVLLLQEELLHQQAFTCDSCGKQDIEQVV